MQRHLLLGLSLIAASAASAACGGGPTAPPGPNGGDNTLSMERDGKEESFDSITMTLKSLGPVLQLTVSGTYDGPDQTADAGYQLNFSVQLDPSELAKLTYPTTLTIDGTIHFSNQDGAQVMTSYERGPMAAPAIIVASVGMTCFCAPGDNGTQKQSGTLTLQKATDTQLYGSLSVTADGYLPGRGAASVVKIVADFDVDTSQMIVSGLTAR